MIPIEETDLFKKIKDNVHIEYNHGTNTARVYVDVIFTQSEVFPFGSVEEVGASQYIDNSQYCAHNLARDAIQSIIYQCGIEPKDLDLIRFVEAFAGKDCYDYIPGYRGCRMGTRDSRHEESSGVVGEE